MYSENDWRDYLAHSWGKKPEQKAREKAYNAKYYREHPEKWKRSKVKYGKHILEDKAYDIHNYGEQYNAAVDALAKRTWGMSIEELIDAISAQAEREGIDPQILTTRKVAELMNTPSFDQRDDIIKKEFADQLADEVRRAFSNLSNEGKERQRKTREEREAQQARYEEQQREDRRRNADRDERRNGTHN